MAIAVSLELSSSEDEVAVVGGGVHEAENKAAIVAAELTGSIEESAIATTAESLKAMETPKQRRREHFRWRRSSKNTGGDQANTAIAASVMENDVIPVIGNGADHSTNETLVAAADSTGKIKKKKNRMAMGTTIDVVAVVGGGADHSKNETSVAAADSTRKLKNIEEEPNGHGLDGSGDEVKKNTGIATATESSRKISKINRSQKSFPCKFKDICDHEFSLRKRLNKHEKNDHRNLMDEKQCLTKNNEVKDGQKKHKRHIKMDKGRKMGAEKKFRCPYPSCSRCFRTEKNVN